MPLQLLINVDPWKELRTNHVRHTHTVVYILYIYVCVSGCMKVKVWYQAGRTVQ